MVADTHSGLRPSRIGQREFEDLASDDEAVRADVACSGLRQAFEEADADELPSFRPLVRGVPAPRHKAHRLPSDLSSCEASAAIAPLPFSRARALSVSDAPPLATRGQVAPTAPPRRAAFRSTPPFLLACFFLSGTVAGLGGAFATHLNRFDGGAIEEARASLSALIHTVAWRRASGGGDVAVPARMQETATAIPAEGAFPKRLPSTVEVSLPVASAAAASAAPADGEPAPAATATRPAAMFALERGDEAMTRRDVFAARRWYEFAASAGVAGAASAVARTYDPVYLQQLGVRGVRPDVEAALRWYQRAWEEGAAAARPR